MMLSRRDIVQIACAGLGGLILAGGVGLFNVFVQRKMLPELLIATKHLATDKMLLMQLAELQSIAGEKHRLEFMSVVDSCDQLIGERNKALEAESALKQMDDPKHYSRLRAQGSVCRDDARKQLDILLAKFQSCESARRVVEVEGIIKQIRTQLDQNFAMLFLKTE